MDVQVVWQVLFCLTEHDAEEDGEKGWGQDAPLLDVVGDEGNCLTETHCASPDLAGLHEAGGGW